MAARPNDGPQTPDALVDDIEHTREQLATTIDMLVDRANPKNIAATPAGAGQGAVRRRRRLAAARQHRARSAGAVVGFVAVVVVIRRVVG